MGFFDKLLNPTKALTSGKDPQMFDFVKERQLLKEYKPHKRKKNSDEYFAALPFINFYYKFRNLDDKYLEKCIEYCNICISCLDSPDIKKEVKHDIQIPAFRKLITIYEKQGNYSKSLEIAEYALSYSKRGGEEAAYYKKKIDALKKKIG